MNTYLTYLSLHIKERRSGRSRASPISVPRFMWTYFIILAEHYPGSRPMWFRLYKRILFRPSCSPSVCFTARYSAHTSWERILLWVTKQQQRLAKKVRNVLSFHIVDWKLCWCWKTGNTEVCFNKQPSIERRGFVK